MVASQKTNSRIARGLADVWYVLTQAKGGGPEHQRSVLARVMLLFLLVAGTLFTIVNLLELADGVVSRPGGRDDVPVVIEKETVASGAGTDAVPTPDPASTVRSTAPKQPDTTAREDTPAPETPTASTSRQASAPSTVTSRGPERLYDALSLELLPDAEASPVTFPMSVFRNELAVELSSATTQLDRIRVGVAFIEPSAHRASSFGGRITGHLKVALLDAPGCVLALPTQTYTFSTALQGIRRSIYDNSDQIADWLETSASGGRIQC